MSGREVTLYLKYPGSNIALQRLQLSYLECVVEHKSGNIDELQSFPPSYLKSDYQLKGTATLEDDELVISFAPKHSGLHTVRIFADTRELCKPVAFIINHDFEVESTPIDKPIKGTSSLFRHVSPSPVPSTAQSIPQQQQQRMSQPYGTQVQRLYQSGGYGAMQWGNDTTNLAASQPQPQQYIRPPLDENFMQGFDPQVSANFQQPYQEYHGTIRESSLDPTSQQQQRHSHVTSGGGSRPPSMVRDDPGFAGDLITMTPEKSTFNQLHAKKASGEQGLYVKKNFLAMDHNKVVTPDTFEMLNKDINQLVGSKGMKTRRRCSICSKKVKISKLMYFGEHDFCESCFKRQYVLRTAIDHFVVPVIHECAVDVPINKKGTKFVTTRKTIPDMNLRGLEPNEVRYAQEEFKKFDMDSSGWISKAVLIPLMKACFSARLNDHEIRHLLNSQSLRDLMTSYGLNGREEVHELEFLSLLAFVAREANSLRGVSGSKTSKFSPSDLEMAYAFHKKLGHGMQKSNLPQPRATGASNISPSSPAKLGQSQISPEQVPVQNQNAFSPHYRLETSPKHNSAIVGQQQQDLSLQGELQRGFETGQGGFTGQMQRDLSGQGMRFSGQNLQRSSNEYARQSARYSEQGDFQQPGKFSPSHLQQVRDDQRMSLLLAANSPQQRASMPPQQHHHLETSGDYDRRNMGQGMQLHPLQGNLDGQQQQDGGIMLNASKPSAFSEPLRAKRPGTPPTGGMRELPEEDQTEQELPTLPPNKDASRETISLHKKQTNSKKIMQDLKLTGDSADSWMLY